MPASKAEQVLEAMKALLETAPGAVVERNSVLSEKVPAGGLIILRDGDPGEPEQALGGFGNAYYQHAVEIEVYVSTAERRCIAVAEQECVSRRDEKGPARGPCHLAVRRAAVGCRRSWASVDGACSAGADSSHRSSRGCGRDG
jgi:hypothetical protein